MFGFLAWLIIGLVAGALARLLVPGRQPMGLFMTMLLGLIGSMVGGFVSSLIFGYDPTDPGFHPGGLIMSTLGAIVALALYLRVSRTRRISP
jgi:uncharacterized membrane protein YeaQ/YmgE (transglycosylase-associated protein family)